MGVVQVEQFTCDCCQYVSTTDVETVVTLTIGSGAPVMLCTTHGCGSALQAALSSLTSTAVSNHRAAIVGGVIPPHA